MDGRNALLVTERRDPPAASTSFAVQTSENCLAILKTEYILHICDRFRMIFYLGAYMKVVRIMYRFPGTFPEYFSNAVETKEFSFFASVNT